MAAIAASTYAGSGISPTASAAEPADPVRMETHANLLAPGHRALRHGRHSATGLQYIVTTCTAGRIPVFAEFRAGCAAARAMHDPLLWRQSRALCWVLMPDHLHAIVELGQGDALGPLMARVKSSIGRLVNREMARKGRLWQPAFHERALRSDDNVRDAARHLVGNPIRAGLSSRVGDYPFWNAVWLQAGDETAA